jgi:hypothetical protein
VLISAHFGLDGNVIVGQTGRQRERLQFTEALLVVGDLGLVYLLDESLSVGEGLGPGILWRA